MILEILKFPDPRLRKKGETVQSVTPQLQELVANMLETMYHAKGIGLAAPQVGESVRLLVIDTRHRDENGEVDLEDMTELERAIPQPLVIFNPEILQADEKTSYDEGCLSVPGFYETVERSRVIRVRFLDLQGQPQEFAVDGLLAICIQHEMDHLEGKLFIDRLSFVKSTRIKNRIKKNGYPTPEEMRDERARRRQAHEEEEAL